MQDLEKMIEKYRRELVEFSGQSSFAEESAVEEKEPDFAPVMANALPFIGNVGADQETEFYKNFEERLAIVLFLW